ncbi:hypothetical protein NC653_020274 [Populus alba x Populus x berolinensis]|uniref:Uncharacterized protein n=1 Tax=Populus alba x Populus x berolinensis TaxID=444605 RepID=A0AAD6MKT7_9ROSI|nr:hypothetical protein NC653_020274 [Populus alba x Populus x berolinensis]
MVLGFESSRGGEKDLCFLDRDLYPSSKNEAGLPQTTPAQQKHCAKLDWALPFATPRTITLPFKVQTQASPQSTANGTKNSRMLACVFFSKYPQMLSRSRFINPRRSLLQLFTTAHRFSKKLNISSSPVPEVLLNHLDEECVDFLPWLERKAGVEISSKLYVGKSAYGRSLFASKSIQTGECILRVPYNVVSLLTHNTAAIAVSNFLTFFLRLANIFLLDFSANSTR